MLLKRRINKMENKEKINGLVQEVLAKSEEFKPILEDIKNCIKFYKVSLDGAADMCLWRGGAYTPESGVAIFEAYARLSSDEKEKSDLRELKQYWIEHYSNIRKSFFERKQG
jgi:hypothetical protein